MEQLCCCTDRISHHLSQSSISCIQIMIYELLISPTLNHRNCPAIETLNFILLMFGLAIGECIGSLDSTRVARL
jgi:hypothetical protein